MPRILFVVSEDWYFVSHRLHLARAAIKAGYEIALLCHGGKHFDLIQSQGIKCYNWTLNRASRNPIKEFQTIVELRKTIADFKPNLIHSVAIKPVVYSALASLKHSSVGRVAALGGLGFIFHSPSIQARLLRPFIARALRWALGGTRAHLILQNPDDQTLFLNEDLIKPEKLHLIRGAGVDVHEFEYRLPSSHNSLVVLPARLLRDKGVYEFVEIARLLKQEHPHLRFALVGDRDEHNPECIPSDQIHAWVEQGLVEWWGRRDDMPHVFATSHIICFPSYREGLPKALLEAASCGRPIVCFDVPGCREVVKNGINGYLIPPKDVVKMADAVLNLCLNADLRNQMGLAGREYVTNNFTDTIVAEETKRIWELAAR